MTLTPYFRHNQMKMMPSWMVTYDPNIRDYKFHSYGMMSKYRNQISENLLFITGVDLETTPSSYLEEKIDVVKENDIYVSYQTTGKKHYDFDAIQKIISPYLHLELENIEQWIFSLGLRYDYYQVDYTDNIVGYPVDSKHHRPGSQSVDFDNFSPKLGAVYQINDEHNFYMNYRHAFVAPSVGRLFRPGSSLDSENLQPVIGKSYELGLRGNIFSSWKYELAIYELSKTDDIVTYIDGNDRKITNAGETNHQGIEIGLQGEIADFLFASFAWTKTNQEYEEFGYLYQCFSPACGRVIPGPPIIENRNFAGNKIGKAPESLANISINYYPSAIPELKTELEMSHVGEYFTDETNTQKYSGHDLFNLRINYEFSERMKLNFRVMNLTDKTHSTYTSNQVNDQDISYRPGLPRSYYLSLGYSL